MQARAESAQATRERIVGAMVELLLERWYDEVTLRDLAKDADVALQTIVNHFSNKEGVLAATLEDPRLADAFGGDRYELGPGHVGLAVDRQWVQDTFPAALDGLAGAERERRVVLLICATDAYTWQVLRRDQKLTRSRPRRRWLSSSRRCLPGRRWRRGRPRQPPCRHAEASRASRYLFVMFDAVGICSGSWLAVRLTERGHEVRSSLTPLATAGDRAGGDRFHGQPAHARSRPRRP